MISPKSWAMNCGQFSDLNPSELIARGYDPGVAERIVRFQPSLARLIVGEPVTLAPSMFVVRPDIISSFPQEHYFASQHQDRSPVTVYRGIKGTGDDYDPTYYHAKPYHPELGDLVDSRTFTTDRLAKATRYPEAGAVILRMQFPRFLLYTSAGGPWGLIFFREMVPNDLVFVTGVAFLEPGVPEGENIEFLSLEAARPRLPRAFKTLDWTKGK